MQEGSGDSSGSDMRISGSMEGTGESSGSDMRIMSVMSLRFVLANCLVISMREWVASGSIVIKDFCCLAAFGFEFFSIYFSIKVCSDSRWIYYKCLLYLAASSFSRLFSGVTSRVFTDARLNETPYSSSD